MAEYSGNSDKSRENVPTIKENRLTPVVTGTTVQKQSSFSKFASNFIMEDIRSVCSYILTDVFQPAIKKLISDAACNGIDMLLYGKTGVTKQAQNGPKISYANYYASNNIKFAQPESKSQFQINSSAYNLDTIIFPTRGDAEYVLECLADLLDSRQIVTVGDFYDLAGIETTNYMVNKYGWTNLHGAEAVRRRSGDGYILNLPKIQEIRQGGK